MTVSKQTVWRLAYPQVLATLLTAFALTLCGQTQKPNVVLLFADDLGYGSVSFLGGDIPTPNIDSIAKNGVGFSAGYMTAPVCNPSRPGLMTGRYQQRWGKELNSQTVGPIGAPKKMLPMSETTIASGLKKLGYATGAVGKWQLGMKEGYHPLDRGFDSFLGMPSGSRFVDPSWPGVHIAPGAEDDGTSDGTGRPRTLYRGRNPIKMEHYLTDTLGGEGVSFIEKHKDEPFFLYLAFHAPHGPIQTIDKYYDRFPHVENETLRIYSGMISAVDDWVGAVLAKLREHGLEENTLVIFTSDNGATQPSDVDGKRNAPFIGHKRNLYEGGIHVPFAMQWEGRFNGARTFAQPVMSIDIFPTVLMAGGAKDLSEYKLDGVDLLPYVQGEKQGAPHEYLFWRSGPNAAVRQGKWKLLMAGADTTWLSDIEADPAESKNLAVDHPNVVDRLRKAHVVWSKDKAPPRESARKVKTKYYGDVIEWHI